VVEGSPLIMLRAVLAAEAKLNAARAKGFRINAHFYFTDTVQDHCAFLMEQIRKSEFSNRLNQTVFVRNGDFNDLAPKIFRK
jgi:three-Cys-motif partner protein